MNPVGIDLGTTFSAIASCDAAGRLVIIPNSEGKALSPSVVSFRDGTPIVGESANELQALGYPTAAFFKRQMGEANWVFTADGVEYSAVDLSAFVLASLKADAEQATGSRIIDAMITVPAYFRNPEREATIAAGIRGSFRDEHDIDLLAERDGLGELLVRAEEAKKRLSAAH